jgi:hypothetical protein
MHGMAKGISKRMSRRKLHFNFTVVASRSFFAVSTALGKSRWLTTSPAEQPTY